jgi:hypothetical protein
MFAKTYDIEGEQVLVQKGQHPEDGRPTLTYTTEVEGMYVDLVLSFTDSDEGYEDRDKSFDNFGQENAVLFREKVIDQLAQFEQE